MNLLSNVELDPELREGARNAIRVCLRVDPKEAVTVITDRETSHIAASLIAELQEIHVQPSTFVLEEFAPRPHSRMPVQILESLEIADVSIYCVTPQVGEITTRTEMIEVVERRSIRHAHMVYITRQIMMEGMRANFYEVDAISRKVFDLARATHRIVGTTDSGSHIEAKFSSKLRWVKTSGIITREKWANLPGGEVLTSPIEINGTYVVDGVVGDYLCSRYGDLGNHPLILKIQGNKLADAQCDRKDLLLDFLKYVTTDENSNRVGEFAIGTNIGVDHFIGNILQDEKHPGIHIAFGNPYPKHTGANWKSSTHIDVISRNWNIWMDNRQIMENGAFTFD
jgi:leucyl aminopeptidase (aminopeptidase T)